jgi:hypothetical protein
MRETATPPRHDAAPLFRRFLTFFATPHAANSYFIQAPSPTMLTAMLTPPPPFVLPFSLFRAPPISPRRLRCRCRHQPFSPASRRFLSSSPIFDAFLFHYHFHFH